MTLDLSLITCLAFMAAAGIWLIVEANLAAADERKKMTPEQRKAADEEIRILAQEW